MANMFDYLIEEKKKEEIDLTNNMFADLMPKLDNAITPIPAPIQTPIPTFLDKLKAFDVKGLTSNINPKQFVNNIGNGLSHGLANLPMSKQSADISNMLTRNTLPGMADIGKQQQIAQQSNNDYLKANPVKGIGGMVGEQIPQLPLWLMGEGAINTVGKGLGKAIPSLVPFAEKVGSKLPGIVKGGLKDALTFGSIVAPVENINQGGNLQSLIDKEKQVPAMALGGMAFRGAGNVLGKGFTKLKSKLSSGSEDVLGPLTESLDQGISKAYKVSSFRDAKTQQLEKTFSDTNGNMGITGPTLPRQGMNSSELLKQKELNAQSAFGDPLKSYKITNDSEKSIAEITAKMDKQITDLSASLKNADGQTRIENIRKRVKDLGGISPGNKDLFEEQKIIPNWIRNKNGRPLDEMADTLGMDSNQLLEAISGSGKKVRDYETEAYRIAHNDPEYQALSNTLDTLRSGTQSKQTLRSLPTLKPREIKANLESPLSPRPENPGPLQWNNKSNIPQADLPYKNTLESSLPKNSDNLRPMDMGVGQVLNNPSLKMNLQRFNNDIPVLPDTASHIVSKTERQPTSLATLRTNAYIKTTDNLHRFDQLDQYVEKTTGKKLSPTDKTYMLALNSRGTGSIASHILEENLVNTKGEVVGDSLKIITKQLKNKKVAKEFDDYLVNKHAITRMKTGEKVYPDEMEMTPEMSEAKVKEIDAAHPEFKDLSDKLYEFQNKLTKSWLVDTGIVSPDAYGKWIIDNPHYVPNNRFFSELEKPGFGSKTKSGFSGQSNPVKARTGSQRKIISPLEIIMEHTDQYVKVAKRNEVMQTLIRNLEKNPEEFKDWAEILPSDGQLKEGLMGDINKTLETDGIDGVVEAFNKQFDDVFNAKKQRLDLGNIVTGLINGEKVHVKINDPLLLDALTNLKPQAQQVVIAALGQLTRVMKNLTTGINPMFGLARNIWRDIPTAFINSKSTNNPFVFGKDLLGSIIDVAGNKEIYKSYKAMGGGYASSSVSASRNTLAESKGRLLPGYALKHPFKTALGGLERLNNTVETAPRLGEFKRVSKAGDYASRVKGLYEANDVTTNFSKFGNVVKEADAVFPYLNAAWQGIDKLGRTFKDNPIQASIKSVVAVTIPTIMLYQLNHNNPAYQQLSDYIKDNNFLFPKSDGTFIKIPKPREVGVVFGSSVERAMREWQDKDPEPFNRFMETIKTNFTPPTRSILAPLSDIRSNKNFMDAPIVSGAVSRLSPSLQFDEKTSEPAKKIGKVFNKSPQQLDYLARSYLGGVAQLGLPAMTKNASLGGVLKKQVTSDPAFSNDIIGDFYNTKDKIDTSAADAKATGNKKLEVGQSYKTLFNNTNTKLGDIRKKVDKIQASTLSNADKEAKIRDLQIQMLTIAKAANSKFKLK